MQSSDVYTPTVESFGVRVRACARRNNAARWAEAVWTNRSATSIARVGFRIEFITPARRIEHFHCAPIAAATVFAITPYPISLGCNKSQKRPPCSGCALRTASRPGLIALAIKKSPNDLESRSPHPAQYAHGGPTLSSIPTGGISHVKSFKPPGPPPNGACKSIRPTPSRCERRVSIGSMTLFMIVRLQPRQSGSRVRCSLRLPVFLRFGSDHESARTAAALAQV